MRDDVSGKTHLAMSQKCSMLSVPGSASHRHPGRGGGAETRSGGFPMGYSRKRSTGQKVGCVTRG